MKVKYRQVFYCQPDQRGTPPACSALPCQGHVATQYQELVARVLAELEGVPWSDLVQADHRRLVLQARALLYRMRHRDSDPTPEWRH